MSTEHQNKIAQITLIFWLMKIVATTLGETLGDYISMTMNLGYARGLLITLVFFLIALSTQLYMSKYIPFIYWIVIISTTLLGTEISDFIDRTLHLGYALGSTLLVTGLLLTLFLWFDSYKSLNVFPVSDTRKEIYYWTAILFSNSLGTAFGDFLGEYFGLSYLEGAFITGVVILIVILVHYLTKFNPILLFWIAFIFTRPFGATFGDFLTKPLDQGGLQLGTLNASLFSVTIMLILILVTQRQQRLSINRKQKLLEIVRK